MPSKDVQIDSQAMRSQAVLCLRKRALVQRQESLGMGEMGG